MSNISRLTSLAAAGVAKGPSEIGEFYGGGYYTGNIVEGGDEYYVLVSPKASGYSASKTIYNQLANPPAGFVVALNDGSASSASLPNTSTWAATFFCNNLSINGYTDWYLPSRDELELCYRNLKAHSNTNNTTTRFRSNVYGYPAPDDAASDKQGRNRNSNPPGPNNTSSVPSQTSVTAFQTGGSEAFTSTAHLTSSLWGGSAFWNILFNNGEHDRVGMSTAQAVRAVRRELV